jgi:hypothetical protein
VPTDKPATSPQFSNGNHVRVTVPGGGSRSVLEKCPTGFAENPIGMASDGDEAIVLERQACGQEWWYRIKPQAPSAAWQGDGWLMGQYLKLR